MPILREVEDRAIVAILPTVKRLIIRLDRWPPKAKLSLVFSFSERGQFHSKTCGTTPIAMSTTCNENILAWLTGADGNTDANAPWDTLAATEPDHDLPAETGRPQDSKPDSLPSRVDGVTADASGSSVSSEHDPEGMSFVPIEPQSFAEAELTDSAVEALILKYLLARGDAAGRDVADQVKLPFGLIDPLLREMKSSQLVVHRCSAPMNDFHYQLTDLGRERARRHAQHCTYFGAAPVSLEDYIASIGKQSLTNQKPTAEDLHRAFDDLLLNKRMLDRLGPAINSGRGLFLYGAPGNGKTSIAERVTAAFGQTIWIPQALGVDGEIVRLYDPIAHEEAPLESNSGVYDSRKIDARWVRIRRPTIVAGGELTMSSLEVAINTSTGINEAPLQMKSNCGTLVIDDFGRQRMRIEELLNRWIVPLEKRYDFLNLPNGKKIEVPFDQLIVFSTNLEPRDLVDEAFLRRIPYKIEVIDPTEEEFRRLFRIMVPRLGFEYREEPVNYLI